MAELKNTRLAMTGRFASVATLYGSPRRQFQARISDSGPPQIALVSENILRLLSISCSKSKHRFKSAQKIGCLLANYTVGLRNESA
jgi:hypothetical protein